MIGLASGDKVSSAEQYRTLSVWKGDETFECVNIALEHPVQELEYIEGSEAFLAASDDAITIVDSDLTPRCLRFSPLKKTTPGGRSTTLRKVLVLRPSRGADEDVLEVVLVYNAGSAIILRVSDFAGPDAKIVNERVVNLAGEATHLAKGEEIVDAFLNGGKAIHLQTSRGRILANGLVIDGSATCTKYGFKTAENATAAVAAISTPTGSLLVACKPAPTGSKLVLFQPNYPSVLAVRDLPASLANAVSTSLVRLTDTVLGLVSCEAAAAGGDGKARAHAWAIDLSLPSQGVGIAQMLESHAKTREYLELEVTQASAAAVVHTPRKGGLKKPSTSTSSTAAAARDQTLLTSLDECLKGRTASAGQEKDAEDAWTRWLAEEKAQKSASAAEHAAGGRSKSKFASSVVEMVLSRALGREPGARPPSTASDAPDASELSNSAPTTTGPRGAYARNIIVSLLEQGWISDRSFAPQGVILGGLLPLGDWTSIDLALRRMRSVDSTTTVALLKRVVQSAESAAAHTQSASGVVSAPPSLARFLRTFVQVPTSPPLHRVALHRAGFTAEESTRILDVLVGWFEEDAQHQEGMLSKGWEEMMGLPASANTSSDAHQGKGRSRGMKGVEIDQVRPRRIFSFPSSVLTAPLRRSYNTSHCFSTHIFRYCSHILQLTNSSHAFKPPLHRSSPLNQSSHSPRVHLTHSRKRTRVESLLQVGMAREARHPQVMVSLANMERVFGSSRK